MLQRDQVCNFVVFVLSRMLEFLCLSKLEKLLSKSVFAGLSQSSVHDSSVNQSFMIIDLSLLWSVLY